MPVGTMKAKLDRIDLKILTKLQSSGRISNKELADEVGLSASPCLTRVKRLEKAGLIAQYTAHLNIRSLSEAIVVLCHIYLQESSIGSAKLLEDHILSLPQTCDFHDVNGECDYIVRFICKGTEDYYALARHLLEDTTLRVRHLSSHIVLRELKPFRGYDIGYLIADERR